MTIEDVENLAQLARIELEREEKEAILEDMKGILAYIESIEKVELGNVEPEYDLVNIWREDKPEPRNFSRDLIISQFPSSRDEFLKVKKIL